MATKLESANVQSTRNASVRDGARSFVSPCYTITGEAYAKRQADALRRDVAKMRPAAYK